MVEEYLNSKTNAWADTTIDNARACLRRYGHCETPEQLWEEIKELAPYTRTFVYIRVSKYREYLTNTTQFQTWRKENAKVFKNVYHKKTPRISYGEAEEKIAQISDEEVRRKAYQLLHGGLRIGESSTVVGGYCIGKGNRRRKVFVKPVPFSRSEATFRRILKKETGLTPHMLRKIKATHVAREARPEQLCKLFGWSNFNTAMSYIDAGREDELERLMK